MKEKERKFMLTYLPDYYYMEDIQQGYLMIDNNRYLRVRVIDNAKSYLCYKTVVSQTEKNEFEYEIPLNDAIELLQSTQIKLFKKRYKTSFDNQVVDIDCYENGLKVCEIEYENEPISIPDYCGEEITGNKSFSNISIAFSNQT